MTPRVILGTWWPRRRVWRDDAVRLDVRAGTATRAGVTARMSPTEFRIAACILASSPAPASVDQLIAAAWGDRVDGGPDLANSNIGRHLWHIRRRLVPIGIVVMSLHGRGWFAYADSFVPGLLREAA